MAQAEDDLGAADDLRRSARHNLACFPAQQAAEKAAKAFLYAQDVDDPWGHSVARLLEEAASFDEAVAELLRMGRPLDKYYIATRYPNALPAGAVPSEVFTVEDATDAIRRAQSVISGLRKLVGEAGGGGAGGARNHGMIDSAPGDRRGLVGRSACLRTPMVGATAAPGAKARGGKHATRGICGPTRRSWANMRPSSARHTGPPN